MCLAVFGGDTRMVSTGDLKMWASRLIDELRKAGVYDSDPINEGNRQALALAAEAGEAVGAYMRYTGQARRNGTKEEFEDELADVIVTAFATAYVAGSDPDVFIERKLRVIFERGWKESPCP